MRVRVRVFGDFRRYLGEQGGRTILELAEGTAVRGLWERLGIRDDEVGLASVNGTLATADVVLQDGDDVDVFSPIGGG